MSKSVKSIGDLTNAAEALKKIDLPDGLKESILVNGLDNVSSDAAKAALGITEVGAAATASTSGISAFGAALKGLWASIAPFVLPALGAIAKKKYPLL